MICVSSVILRMVFVPLFVFCAKHTVLPSGDMLVYVIMLLFAVTNGYAHPQAIDDIVCMHACMYIYIYMYVCMYVCVYVCMYACLYVCMSVCLYACMYECMCACMYVLCVCVCVCVCLHVCLYVHSCMHVCMCVNFVRVICSSQHLCDIQLMLQLLVDPVHDVCPVRST
jgi:hypothetical protein